MISNVNMMGLVSNISAVVAPDAVVGITEYIYSKIPLLGPLDIKTTSLFRPVFPSPK